MSAAQDLLNDQQAFITTLQTTAGTAILNAQNSIAQWAPNTITPVPVDAPTPYEPGTPPTQPTFTPVDPPDAGVMPTLTGAFGDVPAVFAGGAPTFGVAPPTLDFGATPDALAAFSEAAPAVTTSFVFPDVPAGASAVFTAPTILPHAAPDAPTLVTPTFDGVSPVNDAVAPTGLDLVYDTNFTSMRTSLSNAAETQMDAFLLKINPQYHTQMTALETQLNTYLAGGTGLSTTVEDAIYFRGRARNDLEAQRVQNAAFEDTAARGFTLPGGALASALARARQEAANNQNKTTNEIIVMQAEMEQKNLQFAVTTSADLRKSAVASMLAFYQNSIAMSGMALDYSKNIVNTLIQVYDTQVKVFATKLEAYKAEASVFDTKTRAAMQLVEVYKSQIQAYEALVNVDKTNVELYRAQIATIRDYVEVYKAQIESVVSKASLEKLKIELFQSQVQAYSAQVQAKTAEYQGYQAQLSAQDSKAKVFSAQAAVFNAEAGVFKAQHESTAEKIKAETTRNAALLQEFSAKLGAYEADLKAKTAVAMGNIETTRQQFTTYKGAIDFGVATENMKLEAYRANVNATLQTAKQNMDAQVSAANVSGHVLNALAKVHGEILQIYSGPASAAAAGMNSLASVNFQE